jgi:hypothetical protein
MLVLSKGMHSVSGTQALGRIWFAFAAYDDGLVQLQILDLNAQYQQVHYIKFRKRNGKN